MALQQPSTLFNLVHTEHQLPIGANKQPQEPCLECMNFLMLGTVHKTLSGSFPPLKLFI